MASRFPKEVGGALFWSLIPFAAYSQQRPNILYIMTDDHTAQMMSCYNDTYVQTPNLDRIARDGVRFVNSFVANSLSGPSRACMITGKHSHKNGFTNNEHGVFDGSQQTMPKLLQQAGYSTCLIGKWHLVSKPTGFDHYEIIPGQGEYYNPTFITMDGKTHREEGYLTNILTDKAISWLAAQQQTNKPFAMFLHEKACHRDWLPELKYLHEYENVTFPLPENFNDDWAGRLAAQRQEMDIASDVDMTMDYDCKMYDPARSTRLTGAYLGYIGRLNSRERAQYDMFYDSLSVDFRQRNLSGQALKEYKYQRFMRDYAKVLKTFDDNVGRLLDYLDKTGLSENTLVVYTSDQGFYMGEHGWFDKRFMYEESFRTPLIIYTPGQTHGRENDALVQNIDFAPTFLDVAGVKKPAEMVGTSLLPVIERGKAPKTWRQYLYYHYYDFPAEHHVSRHDGVSDGRYKLIHFYGKEGNYDEFYDLKKDPNELHNLISEAKYHKHIARLQTQLDLFRKQERVDEW